VSIQPKSVSFTKNLVAPWAGEQVDSAAMYTSQAVFFFQQLDEKSKALKRALGLLEELDVEKFTPSLEETPTIIQPEITGRISYDDIEIIESLTPDIILADPDRASAQVFGEGLADSFDDWLTLSENGGLQDPTPVEQEIVTRYQTELNTLRNKLKQSVLTPDEYARLYAIPQTFVKEIESIKDENNVRLIPKSKVTNFWQNIMLTYTSVTSLSEPVSDAMNTSIADYSLYIERATQAASLIREITNLIKDIFNPIWDLSTQIITNAFSLNGAEFNSLEGGIIQSLLSFAGLFRQLMSRTSTVDEIGDLYPQNVQNQDVIHTAIDEYVNSLTNLKVNDHVQLNGLLSLVYAYGASTLVFTQKSISNSNQISLTEYSAALEKEIQYWVPRETANFKISDQALTSFKDRPSGDYNGVYLFDLRGAAINLFNPTFFFDVVSLMTTDPKKAMTREDYNRVITASESSIRKINESIAAWEAAIAECNAKKVQMDPAGRNYFDAMVLAKQTFVNTSPIQMVYSSLMLDKYLPNQQYILETLGNQMTFSNKAARYLNDLIAHTVSFQTADVYYALGMYLRQMNFQSFPESISRAKNLLNKEIERCRADLFHCQRAIEEINKLSASVKADTELTSSQRSELLETLASYAFEFNNLYRNLSNVYAMASVMSISAVEKPDDVDEAFTTTIGTQVLDNWIQQFTIFESAVIEGGRGGVMPGGERQVLQSLESKQQDYTSFNQNQQLALQMESAAIQQEWTMVAAALALMNQIFAKLIRRFK
jgi:Protein of unknown function, DUF582.